MKRFFAHRSSGLPFRALSLATAVLVLALSVFAASPELHAWLHAHEHGAVTGVTGVTGNSQTASSPETGAIPADDDGCAIAMFAQGVLCIIAIALLRAFVGRVAGYLRRVQSALARPLPRYWLPPLCGPPLS